ncbi:ubiquinol oxidase subunit II [Brevibacillus centrosporus]|uniref:Quinol oxidase subunit 2 n=1 Tax=Brevibacillus centrosporus TaxID=54910 RepID=A0A1I3LR08_9BACL|nr:ubiquinol oxidase subunit II [Brevibacillus centrosporus]MEC2131331.1 ubiquinol oxidase subunit II [Brevibacillus centrosporus]MED4906856.1 ubiquinol oxidase subunit II [Brevibacillus centrosporus]RNB72635.1 ubiquinol oxidase subunit II [Brevibacillus centrosporus]SFI87224.1 cytochrome aa3-600 menaquinol oxidase subunit 2 [Brevibacillus centrosporus]GED31542.1 quinol oxidase subunit 2 [Brevibacillus centrosporus]
MSGGKMLRQFHFWVLAALATVLLSGCGSDYLVLNPKGPVAETQYNLIVISVILCAVIIVPVLAITAFIVYRYRDTPKNKAPYKPDWAHSTTLEVIWWGIPVIIIAILGYFTVRDTYVLKESPNQEVKPITIQVTALDWKWMFTYPEQNVATVNYLEIPAGVPVRFQVSAEAPMNSFWVPELGGQIYAMSGMATELYLQADEPGEFQGFSANFSGEGFAHMQFKVVAKPQNEFDQWVQQVKGTAPAMTKQDYEELKKPGLTENKMYSAFPEGLFEEIVQKYSHGHDMHHVMDPVAPAAQTGEKKEETSHETHQMSDMSNMPGMDHSGMKH